MISRTPQHSFVKLRRSIGAKVRDLREQHRWTQAELAKRLHLSQAHLSHIERGERSLSAEQFLEVLKLFNVAITEFVPRTADDPLQELQNALARFGAPHLRVSDQVLPSERLSRVHEVIVEVLVSGSPRLLTALAPVLVTNAEILNFARLSVDLDRLGLRRRLYWVIENTIEAIRQDSSRPTSRTTRLASRRLQTAMAFADGYEQVIEGKFDLLDPSLRSKQSVDEVRAASSDISKRWGIITSLRPEDFAAALRGSRAGD